MLRVTPVYGSRWQEKGAASVGNCTLIEYGDVRVLVNVGGLPRPASDASAAPGFPSHYDLPPHDCVVLTDSTMESLGHLPTYLKTVTQQRQRERREKQRLQQQEAQRGGNRRDGAEAAPVVIPPIFATFPTVKMGQMTLYDYHANLCLDGASPPFTLDDIDQAFAALTTIKYSQAMALPFSVKTGRNTNANIGSRQAMGHSSVKPRLHVTAHRAGHVVGGAFYLLQRLQDDTTVVVTSTYHIAKEMHLDSSTLLQHGSTPDVLITRPGGPRLPLVAPLIHSKAMKIPLVSQSERQLVEQILSVLRREGNVLMPVDASGRVLEILLLLDQTWEKQRLQNTYNLVWLGPMVSNTLDFCRSQLEWMAPALGHQFDQHSRSGSSHPFALKNISLCTSIDQLNALTANSQNANGASNPMCVLASGLGLDHGPSRDLLLQWADNDNHAIIFTDSSFCTSRDNDLHAAWTQKQRASVTNVDADVDVTIEDAPTTTTTNNNNITDDSNVELTKVEATTPAAAEADLQRTQQTNRLSTAWQLLSHWCAAKLERRELEDRIQVDVLVPSRSPLVGAALQAFLESEDVAKRKRKAEEEKQALLREVELAKGRLRLGEDSRDGAGIKANGSSSALSLASSGKSGGGNMKNKFKRRKSRFDSSLFLKFSKPLHLTFEVREEAVGIGQSDETSKFGIGGSIGAGADAVLEDDYGITVQAEHFVDIVTGVDPSKYSGGSGRITDGRNGFGYAADGTSGGLSSAARNASSSSSSVAKKRKKRGGNDANDGDGADDGSGVNERGLEAADLSEGKGIIRGRNGRPPVKITTSARKLTVFCEIAYIPLEGRVDSRSARQSVRALQPREVVVLGGPNQSHGGVTIGDTKFELIDEVTNLANAARTFASGSKVVHTPSDADTIELRVGHAAYGARLVDTPYRTVEEKQMEEEPAQPVELQEAKLGPCSVSYLDYIATGQRVALDGSIVLAPNKNAGRSDGNALYLSDGEILLTDLRSELIAQGMKAEYSTHPGYSQLLVNEVILVTKASDSGRINVEGPLCEDFYVVRGIVCNQYVVL